MNPGAVNSTTILGLTKFITVIIIERYLYAGEFYLLVLGYLIVIL
jgi:hypothetical protein